MFEAEVSRGAEWMDQNHPGWERDIDLSTLSMHDCSACIIGQAIWKKTHELAGRRVYPVTFFYNIGNPDFHAYYGFSIPVGRGMDNPLIWGQLEATWEALIKERFSNGTLSG